MNEYDFPEITPEIVLEGAWELTITKPTKDYEKEIGISPIPSTPPRATYKQNNYEAEATPRYLVEAKGKSGAFGIIYKAWDRHLNRVVAVKVLRPYDSGIHEDIGPDLYWSSLELEAKIMARINDPGILQIYDYTQADTPIGHSSPVFVMDYIAGQNLQDYTKTHMGIDNENLIKIIHQVASTIDRLAKRGIFHRDIKPKNILMDDTYVKLVDFGFANWVIPENLDTIMGTPKYISPEAINCQPITIRSEIFSLASTIYTLFVGLPPFVEDLEEHIYTTLKKTLESPHYPLSRNQDLVKRLGDIKTAQLEQVFARAFEKKPEDRYQTATEFAEAFKKALS